MIREIRHCNIKRLPAYQRSEVGEELALCTCTLQGRNLIDIPVAQLTPVGSPKTLICDLRPITQNRPSVIHRVEQAATENTVMHLLGPSHQLQSNQMCEGLEEMQLQLSHLPQQQTVGQALNDQINEEQYLIPEAMSHPQQLRCSLPQPFSALDEQLSVPTSQQSQPSFLQEQELPSRRLTPHPIIDSTVPGTVLRLQQLPHQLSKVPPLLGKQTPHQAVQADQPSARNTPPTLALQTLSLSSTVSQGPRKERVFIHSLRQNDTLEQIMQQASQWHRMQNDLQEVEDYGAERIVYDTRTQEDRMPPTVQVVPAEVIRLPDSLHPLRPTLYVKPTVRLTKTQPAQPATVYQSQQPLPNCVPLKPLPSNKITEEDIMETPIVFEDPIPKTHMMPVEVTPASSSHIVHQPPIDILLLGQQSQPVLLTQNASPIYDTIIHPASSIIQQYPPTKMPEVIDSSQNVQDQIMQEQLRFSSEDSHQKVKDRLPSILMMDTSEYVNCRLPERTQPNAEGMETMMTDTQTNVGSSCDAGHYESSKQLVLQLFLFLMLLS